MPRRSFLPARLLGTFVLLNVAASPFLLSHAADPNADTPTALDGIVAVGHPEPHTVPVGEALRDKNTPQSQLSEQAIHEIATPFGDYGSLARLTPSYVETAPNGPGFDAAKNQSLRGFVDGQFNVTVDGIPLQDPDTFQHHSTSYFPAATLDRVIVDRSPGGATDMGYATLGGTIQLYTMEPTPESVNRVAGSVGSFATTLLGVQHRGATPTANGDTAVLANVEHIQSAGALSNADGNKDDVFLKTVTRLTDSARLTALITFDRYHFNNPPNSTTLRLAQSSSSYGFSANSARPDFYGYQATDRRADMEYLRLEDNFTENWSLDNKLYSYSYANRGLALNGDETSSPMPKGFGLPTSDIAGRLSVVNYRTYGDILTVSHSDPHGVARGGVWVEESRQFSRRDALDLTQDVFYNANKAAHNPIYFLYTSHLTTLQPFAEYQWQAEPWLNVRPGVRFQQTQRDYDAQVNQNFRPGTNGDIRRRLTETLPSLDANIRLDPNTSVLLEIAKGAQLPSQALFYNTNTPLATNQAQPQTAVSHQASLVHEDTHYDVGLTAYEIDFSNYIDTTTTNNITTSTNSGSVRYRGLELEGRVDLYQGLGFIGNASLIRAEYQTDHIASAKQVSGNDVPLVPTYLAQAGLIYNDGRWQTSLINKFVGVEYQGAGGSADPTRRVEPYNYTDFTLTERLGPVAGFRQVRWTFGINNLLDHRSITDNGGAASVAAEGNLINTLSQRSYVLSVVGDL